MKIFKQNGKMEKDGFGRFTTIEIFQLEKYCDVENTESFLPWKSLKYFILSTNFWT